MDTYLITKINTAIERGEGIGLTAAELQQVVKSINPCRMIPLGMHEPQEARWSSSDFDQAIP
jgi:hypothetical protein